MTNEELIQAQENDIRNLIAQLRDKDAQLAECSVVPKFKYDFDTIYFRVESYGVQAYKLCNVVQSKWFVNEPIVVDYRFTELFLIYMPEHSSGSRGASILQRHGGNKLLNTCVNYAEFKAKVARRIKKYTRENKPSSYITYMQDMVALVDAEASKLKLNL